MTNTTTDPMPDEMVTLELHAHGVERVRVHREPYERAKNEARVGIHLSGHLREVETDFEIHEEDGTVVDVETGAIFPPVEPVFVIWTAGAWRSAGGYTNSVWHADRYTKDEALRASRGTEYDVIVSAPESLRDHRFDPNELRGVDALMADRIEAVKAGIAAAKEQN